MTDADRFEAFVREYQDMVFATAVRLLANPVEAEDIAQTVFLRAFERFSSIATSATAAGWLKTVTTNLCLNHLARYRARWQFFSELERPGRRRTVRSNGARAGCASDAIEASVAPATTRAGGAGAPGSSAGSAGPLSLRGHVLQGDRGGAGDIGGKGQDGYSSRP